MIIRYSGVSNNNDDQNLECSSGCMRSVMGENLVTVKNIERVVNSNCLLLDRNARSKN